MEFIQKILITIFLEEFLVFLPLTILFFYAIYSVSEKKNYLNNFIISLLPLFFIFYQYSYLSEFFSSIGQDSLSEINADVGEAIFYLKTFLSFLLDPEIFNRKRFWLLLLSSFSSALIIYLFLQYYLKKNNKNILILNKYFNILLIFSLIVGIYGAFSLTIASLDAGKKMKIFETEFKKNILNFKTKNNSNKTIKTIVYVGESTSALNMGLYGYPFDTSPWLSSQKENKIIKFNRVYATHTHTTPSLVSSFSLCVKQLKKDCSLILDNNNNLSVIDVLNKSDIDTHLFSTQGSLGGHNLATKLIFNTKEKNFSSELEIKNSSRLLGNRYIPKLRDHEYFKKSFCSNNNFFKSKKSSLAILHSYAGHGQYDGYLHHLPQKSKFVYPKYVNKKNLLGKDYKNYKLYNEYDTAIEYIDSSVKEVMKCMGTKFKKNPQPMVFIYFSDHGESPATARGHDSSRLTYEMLHVPFIIIFNDAAHKYYNNKIDELKKLKNKNLSLKFLGDLILYLNDIDVLDIDNNVVYPSNNFKSLLSNYILDRKDLKGNISKLQTFWNYTANKIDDKFLEKNFLAQDTSITLWQLRNFLEKNNLSDQNNIKNLICKHRANSFITQYKASLSNGCFETDIFFLEEKTISAHNLKDDTNLIFDNFFKSRFQKNTIWLDSKNLNKVKNCKYALKWLNINYTKFQSILIETPSSSLKSFEDENWKKCIHSINDIRNVEVGYYMPTETIINCSNEKLRVSNNNECKNFYSSIIEFLKQSKINSITFDYSVYDFIKNNKDMKMFKWHVWHIDSLNSFNEMITNNNIGIMLLKNNKFSNNLN